MGGWSISGEYQANDLLDVASFDDDRSNNPAFNDNRSKTTSDDDRSNRPTSNNVQGGQINFTNCRIAIYAVHFTPDIVVLLTIVLLIILVVIAFE